MDVSSLDQKVSAQSSPNSTGGSKITSTNVNLSVSLVNWVKLTHGGCTNQPWGGGGTAHTCTNVAALFLFKTLESTCILEWNPMLLHHLVYKHERQLLLWRSPSQDNHKDDDGDIYNINNNDNNNG